MNPSPALSIILPCYNEAANIPFIFERFRKDVGERNDVEVILVNNGSTDASGTVIKDLLQNPSNRFARTILVNPNQGYGYGIMKGIQAASGEVLSWTHADLQTDPADVLSAFERFRTQPDMTRCFLKGNRIKRPLLDASFTLGMSLLSSLALSRVLFDVNAQPKMFHRSFLQRMSNPPSDFSLDLYALYMARRTGMIILDHPVNFGQRRHGEAKGGGTLKGKINLIRRTWRCIFRLRREFREGKY